MSNTMASGVPFKRPYRWIMAVLILTIPFATMVPYIAPSVFMADLMADFGVDYSLAGLSITIVLAATGVCMFIGSSIQEKIGMRPTFVLAVWMMAAGTVVSSFAPNIWVFIGARLIVGFGQGVYNACCTPLISTWFADKERNYMIALNNASSSVFLAMSFIITLPLIAVFGSWQGVMKFYSIIVVILAVLWTVFGKDSPEGIAAAEQMKAAMAAAGKAEKGQSGLARAVRESTYWKVFIYSGTFMIGNTVITTYLPTYLTTVRGIDAGLATTITSLNPVFGIVGSLLGGVICAKLPRRKPIMLVVYAAYILCGFGITVFNSSVMQIIVCVATGMFFYLPLTAQTTLTIESKQPFDPTIIPGAIAITCGLGQVVNIFISPIFSAATAAFGMTNAMRVFFILCIVGWVAALTLRETGVKPEKVAVEE